MTDQTVHTKVSTIYVGDLRPEVNEAALLEKFLEAGSVSSIHVCRDRTSRMSLGYAYVNFSLRADAETALNVMNFDPILGRPCRIMWCQRDPAVRKSGVGNIFIKNLEKNIDSKDLLNTFSVFGNILSCKIVMDQNGSKGYGFIHFETEEAAKSSIERINGMLLNGKKVFVGPFLPKKTRIELFGEKVPTFNNVFVKNFADLLNEANLSDLFSKFGTVTSCKVVYYEGGKSKGFGFVCFQEPESAQKAIDEMNGFDIGAGRLLYAGRAQKKSERHVELREKYERIKQDMIIKSQKTNLYLKNLMDDVDEDMLKNLFGVFGTITSVKVMREKGVSKGFGFISFSSAEEAAKALVGMQSMIVCNKLLYIAYAQRKEDRKIMLTNLQYENGLVMNGRSHKVNQGNKMTQRAGYQKKRSQPNGASNQVNRAPNNLESHVLPNEPVTTQVVQQVATTGVPSQLTSTMLVNLSPADQRQLIGNDLYAKIGTRYPELAPKLTGMLVADIDISELLNMVSNEKALWFRVEEAVAVYEAHIAKQRQAKN